MGDSRFKRSLQMATCRETGRDIGAGVVRRCGRETVTICTLFMRNAA